MANSVCLTPPEMPHFFLLTKRKLIFCQVTEAGVGENASTMAVKGGTISISFLNFKERFKLVALLCTAYIRKYWKTNTLLNKSFRVQQLIGIIRRQAK